MSAGTVSVGAVVSLTVTLKLPFPVLPRLSLAEQFTVVAPRGNVLPEAGEQSIATAPSTRSDALAEYVATAPAADVASFVMSAWRISAGGVVSTTLTWNVFAADSLPALSLALQLTSVDPKANAAPGAGEHVTDGDASTASVAPGFV